jgi:Flp pilus assembly protein TadD
VPAGWIALGVAHSMLDAHAQAVEATAHAVTLAPRISAVRVAHGDVLRVSGDLESARRAYAKGVELAPDDADALNKLAGAERMARDFDAAAMHLARALEIAPGHPYAIVNFGTLALERGDAATARERLAAAMRLPRLPRDAAEEAASALAMLDEHAALQPALESALAEHSPAPLEAALRARGAPRRRDEKVIAALDAFIERAAREAPIDDAFAPGTPGNAAWPAIEAHHNFRRLGDGGTIEQTIALVARAPEDVADVASREIVDYADVVARRGTDPFAPADGVAWEAWLRWTHARLIGAHPAFWPGQIKPVNNLLPDNPRTRRTEPVDVPGTLRTVMTNIDAALPPGAWRACLYYLAIIEIHPFQDGNGRLGRYLLNRTLVGLGRYPALRPDNSEGDFARRMNTARDIQDLRIVAEWFAEASHYAARLDATLR